MESTKITEAEYKKAYYLANKERLAIMRKQKMKTVTCPHCNKQLQAKSMSVHSKSIICKKAVEVRKAREDNREIDWSKIYDIL